MVKKGNRKKINDSLWIGLPDKPSRWRIFDLYAHIKTKRLIHWRVYCTRIWKKPLETEGKAATVSSPTITRQSPCVPEEGSDELFLRFALTFKAGNVKTVQSCLIYRLGDEYSQQNVDICVRNCKTQGIHKRSEIRDRRWDCRENC